MDKGILIKPQDVDKYINSEKEYYTSTYYYNNNHLKQFKETGSIKGIKDVTTNKLWFDFDNRNDPSQSQNDAKEVVSRLIKSGISDKNIEIYFSGNKGINVLVTLNKFYTPDQIKTAALKYADGLKTFDLSMYDAVQILRVPGTKHPESKLYKIPLTVNQLNTLSIDSIKSLATSLDNIKENFEWEPVELPPQYLTSSKKEKKQEVKSTTVDLSDCPRHWKPWKWALSKGYFEAGERHHALMILAATCRGFGHTKEQTYYLCKAALKAQAERTGTDEFDKDELWNNIIKQSVYSDSWQGGQYSPKTDPWLKKYCERMGLEAEDDNNEPTIQINDAFSLFKDYATNIDHLTIKTGIPVLDKKVRLTIGMSVGLVASPGVGKTSLALQMLNYMSKSGHKCIFFSYDMFHALVFQKLVQKHFKMPPEEIFERFKSSDIKFQEQVVAKIKEEYGNVEFCFKAGQNIDDIVNTIKHVEEKTGEKVKFIVVDYNELVLTEYSDPTQSSAFVAQKMREIANLYSLCTFSLFQPSKHGGTPSDEILSYHAAKGSGAISQSVSVMLGMSRPGYHPRHPEDDKFTTITCLKNRMGSLFSVDLHWDGLSGSVRELSDNEREHLEDIRKRRIEEKNSEEKWI
jgi:KaiC/GvpD/RAD55 family RecA-like ATPase